MMMHRRSVMAGTGQYDIEAIKRRLPHRYPFLMVDRIEESGPGYAIGIKNVTANEPCFQGHFPHSSADPPDPTGPGTPGRASRDPRRTGNSSPSA